MSNDSHETEQGLVPAGRNLDNKNKISVQDLVTLEHDRLKLERERVAVTHEVARLTDAADQRKYTFSMARLDEAKNRRKADDKRFGKIYSVLVGGIAVIGIIILSLLGMVFFGDAAQSDVARQILRKGVEVAFSGSFFMLFIFLIRHLLRRR